MVKVELKPDDLKEKAKAIKRAGKWERVKQTNKCGRIICIVFVLYQIWSKVASLGWCMCTKIQVGGSRTGEDASYLVNRNEMYGTLSHQGKTKCLLINSPNRWLKRCSSLRNLSRRANKKKWSDKKFLVKLKSHVMFLRQPVTKSDQIGMPRLNNDAKIDDSDWKRDLPLTKVGMTSLD